MSFSKDEFFGAAVAFRSDLLADLLSHGWSLPAHWWIDHLCYRVETVERYREVTAVIGTFAELLAETEVSGRPISTFRLEEAIPGGSENLRIIEVPAPKPGKTVREGFEHAEVVCDEPFNEVKNRFPGAVFDEGGLRKTFNRELEIVLDERNIKFHHLSLESVVTLENNPAIFGALKRSGLLELLKDFDPLPAGTFPLSVATAASDIDLLVTGHDETKALEILRRHFGAQPGFESGRGDYRGGPASVVKFRFENVPIEVFIQANPSVAQAAYRHFQIEERLLALYGEPLLGKVRNHRTEGLKTEAAFCRALDLDGDPYETLLAMHGLPTVELRKFHV